MRCAIFDFDGTLFDSIWVWKDVDLEFLNRYNIVPEDRLRESIKTLSTWEASEIFIQAFNIDLTAGQIVDEISKIVRDRYKNEVMPKKYIKEYLERLKNNNIPMCIATACSTENVTLALKRMDMLKYFEFIISTDEVKLGKNNADIFMLCADRFKELPENITVFEDSLHAVETVKKAGFRVVGIYDAASAKDAEKIKNIADYYIQDYNMDETKNII